MTQHRVERLIRGLGRVLKALGYGIVATVYVGAMTPVIVAGGLSVYLARLTPDLIWRFNPMFNIVLDYSIQVIDEPVVFASYRLNVLFSKFDARRLRKMQLWAYVYWLKNFHDYLEVFRGPNEDYALPADDYADLMKLSTYLSTVSDTPELIPEAIGFIHDWMTDHPIQSDSEHTEHE
jgi:hypothetical protein